VSWQGEDDPTSAHAHIFVTRHGAIQGPEDAHKPFKRACVRAGLGDQNTFHGLRHDFASLLAKLDVPLCVAMEMLGHSQELMTICYQYVSEGDRREAGVTAAHPKAERETGFEPVTYCLEGSRSRPAELLPRAMVPPRERAIAVAVGAYNIALCDFLEDSAIGSTSRHVRYECALHPGIPMIELHHQGREATPAGDASCCWVVLAPGPAARMPTSEPTPGWRSPASQRPAQPACHPCGWPGTPIPRAAEADRHRPV